MTQVYLFDWGDTLMVDFPQFTGKMCDWEKVEAVSGAKSTLKKLSKSSKIYIATGASESSEDEIKSAFKKVELEKINGPIGIKLGGKSPSEIALSIISQLVSEKYKNKI